MIGTMAEKEISGNGIKKPGIIPEQEKCPIFSLKK